jgi:Flp pilus assembly protein TadG
MTIEATTRTRERGIALVYVGVFLVPLLLCTGLAVDLARGYLVHVALAKAVDAAALAAAHNIAADLKQANDTANNIFRANFPVGFLGVNPDTDDVHIDINVDPEGSYVINVRSNQTLPTTFMRLAKFDNLAVGASAQATRRLVDMSFVVDKSKSLKTAGVWEQVQESAIRFVNGDPGGRPGFDRSLDRIALIMFSGGTDVAYQMTAARGFDPDAIAGKILATDAIGPTATAEALFQAWDQLRSVPPDARSGLRIVVLFTDGTPNAFPVHDVKVSPHLIGSKCEQDNWQPAMGTIMSTDYPYVGFSTTSPTPVTIGLYKTDAPSDLRVPPTVIYDYQNPAAFLYGSPPTGSTTVINPCIPCFPAQSYHEGMATHEVRQFPLWNSLGGQRQLVTDASKCPEPDLVYPDHVQNANSAARNLAEIIADQIRSDHDGSPIRIYTLGLGALLELGTGSGPETGASILRRIANDPDQNRDYNPGEPEGRYFPVADIGQLDAAFDKVRDEVVRLSQ